jgi:predicted DNA-binding protein (MmcQ/YjbR family)
MFKQVLNEKYRVFIDTSLDVQLCSKWNYVINMLSQPINNSILKNQYQVKQGTHMNKKKLNINLIQHL